MLKSKFMLSLIVVSMASVTTAASASTRNASMGGVGVASSNYLSSAMFNPALIADYDSSDDFSFSLPSVNVIVSDNDQIIDQVDAIQESYDKLDYLLETVNSVNITEEKILEAKSESAKLSNYLQDLKGSNANLEADMSLAFSIPNQYLSTTVFAKTYADLFVLADVDDSDINLLNSIVLEEDPRNFGNYNLDNIDSSGIVLGAAVTDVGVAFGKKINIGDVEGNYSYNIGLAVKYQRVDTFNYIVDIENFDEDDFNGDEYKNEDSNINVDLGFSMDLNQHWKVGVVGQNLIKQEYKTITMSDQYFTYKINPLVKVGGAYSNDFFTGAIDIDLTKTEKFAFSEDNQFARVGIELNAYDWAQLRFGYRFDMKNNKDGLATMGFGLSPWNVVHLDFAVMYANEDEMGAGLEFSVNI